MRIAESIDSSADAKTWHFNIRQGVEFHNGKTLTAEDAMKTIERHSNEESKSGALGIVKGIESMSVSGNTLTLNLDTPNADLPYLMADYHLAIQPNGGMDDPTAGIGTGPYQIESNEPGVRHTFTKFANHWDDSVGHADSVEILVINDATARMSALQSGQVHMVNSVDPKIANLLDRAPNITVQNVSGRGHYVFIMHTDTPPFDNKELRLALKYAINRQEMVDKILRGYGGVGNDVPINAATRCSMTALSSVNTIRSKQPSTIRTRAMTVLRSSCASLKPPSRALSTQHSCSSKAQPPLAFRWKSSVNRTMATGRKCGTSSPSVRRTGRVARFRTRCTRPRICRRLTGTTPVSTTLISTTCCRQPRRNLIRSSAKSCTATWHVSCMTKAA